MEEERVKTIINEEVDKVLAAFRRGLHPISEANLNRIIQHGKSGMIVISANRSDVHSDNPNCDLTPEYEEWLNNNGAEHSEETAERWLKMRNNDAQKALLNNIKDSGLSYTPVYGGYHGEDGVVDLYEPSFIVYSKDKTGEDVPFEYVYNKALQWCDEFSQESVYVQAPGEAPVYLDKDGNQSNSSSSKNFKYNRGDEMFYTTTKRKSSNPKRFTADIQFESYYRKGVSSYTERMRRSQSGEFFLD